MSQVTFGLVMHGTEDNAQDTAAAKKLATEKRCVAAPASHQFLMPSNDVLRTGQRTDVFPPRLGNWLKEIMR